MTVYMIADVDVVDEEAYQEYIAMAPAIVGQHGGKYLVRGGTVETVEGDWRPRRLVIEAFANMAEAKAWLESPEQQAANAIRHRAARTNLILVEGVD